MHVQILYHFDTKLKQFVVDVIPDVEPDCDASDVFDIDTLDDESYIVIGSVDSPKLEIVNKHQMKRYLKDPFTWSLRVADFKNAALGWETDN